MKQQCDDERSGISRLIRKCFPPSAITGIITAITVALILWLTGTLTSIPANYATRPELKTLETKHDEAIQRLDSTKLDKSTYIQNHADLRNEIKEDLNDLKLESRAQRELLLKIYSSQQTQYKKVNGK
jgi:hypothetical protein